MGLYDMKEGEFMFGALSICAAEKILILIVFPLPTESMTICSQR
jgi:hypothetical protein